MELAEYLSRRLHQVGIRSHHGVPGDYSLNCLDFIPRAGLTWRGNVNELEAGYAADGYARINGEAALVTTFGVGELSASNAIAGAYAEHVPIIHVVGTPPTVAQETGKIMHHTLGDGDYSAFMKMSEHISCLVTDLRHAENPANTIDKANRECLVQRRPVCIYFPMDMVSFEVDSAHLDSPIDLTLPYDEMKGAAFVQAALKELDVAKRPAIQVDQGAIMHQALEEVRDLISKSGLPVFVTPMGRGAIDETLPNFIGVYEGDSSPPIVKKEIESSDFILGIGVIPSDYNTGGFTNKGIKGTVRVVIQGFTATVNSDNFEKVNMRRVIRDLSSGVQRKSLWISPSKSDETLSAEQEEAEESEKDIVITETGSSNFGISMTRFPRDVIAINQVLWGSIGYALGAAEGAAIAAQESELHRTILFTGDGSFQPTVTALSSMLRYRLTPIIFIICNKGYTVERYVHGMEALYNDIKSWNYTLLPKAFDAEDRAQTYQIKTRQQLRELFENKDFNKPEKLQLVELWMPKEDAPTGLKKTAQAVKQNAG